MSAPRARARVLRALALAEAGARNEALRWLAAALERDGGDRDAVCAAAAGVARFVCREYHGALEALASAGRASEAPGLPWLAYERALRLGWDREARAALEDCARRSPADPRPRAALLALFARRRAWLLARETGEALASREGARDAPRIALERAGVHLALGELERAAELARSSLRGVDARGALGDEGAGAPLRLEAARVLRGAGRLDEARACLERAADHAPRAHVTLAELALDAGEASACRAHAERASEAGYAADAERLRASLALAQGDLAAARAHLERARALGDDSAEGHLAGAELALREGAHRAAHDALARATAAAGRDRLAGQLLRLRVKLDEERLAHEALAAHATEHLRAPLRALCPRAAVDATLEGHDAQAWRALLDMALARLPASRCEALVLRGDASRGPELVALAPPSEPRFEARRALERVRVEDEAALLDELRALAERFPRSGLPLAHRGELLLWLGRVDEARDDLEAALRVVPGTRWAHIGLSAVALLEGDAARALALGERGAALMRGTIGPALYVHRGEALLRLGRVDEAARELTRSVALHPSRVAAWNLLGLAQLARGDEPAARASLEHARARAPGLYADAAREGALALDDAGAPARASDVHALLEQAQRMLQGNRASSTVSYRTGEGALRFGRAGAELEPLHARDADELRYARALLERGLAALPLAAPR